MEHRGEIIEQAVRKSGMPLVTISKKMGKSRRWLYLQFENPLVSLDVVLQIGKIIYYDFSDEIQLLKVNTYVAEPNISNGQDEVIYWKEKYFKVMEEYHVLLKKIAFLELK